MHQSLGGRCKLAKPVAKRADLTHTAVLAVNVVKNPAVAIRSQRPTLLPRGSL
jgi:hypothetical protein